jgi:hypothetical protein
MTVQAREPSRASLPSSRTDRAEPSLARLGSFPALVALFSWAVIQRTSPYGEALEKQLESP